MSKNSSSSPSSSPCIGLVLSGGGARGAYQVGVLSAVADIAQELKLKNPFRIYTGVSAGAINASFLAAGAEDFAETTKRLVDMWSHLRSDQIFYTDAISIGKIGFKWLEELSFGALSGTTPGRSLLDTSPLRDLISQNMNFENIQQNIASGKIDGVAVTAMDYQTSAGVTFMQAKPEIKTWSKARRRSEAAMLQPDHVLASSAIPLLFPPVEVKPSFFGDGCIRNQSPCGPAIYMGAEKLVVIGVRMNMHQSHAPQPLSGKAPSVARVVNVLLNAVMLDGIEIDLERLDYINRLVDHFAATSKGPLPMKRVDYAWVSPSVDIGQIAQAKASKLPRIIRYLLKGLGSLEDAREIISYLLFEPSFCTELIERGFEDGMRQREQIRVLLAGE